MKPAFRTAVAALVLIAASYGVVAATNQTATAETTTDTTTIRPVTEVGATDTTTPLPGGSSGDLVIDETHGQVFISRPNLGSVIVTDLDGQIVSTIEGFAYPTQMAISPDDGTVYVTELHATSIGVIATGDLTATHASLPANQCPQSVEYTGGKTWYVYQDCGGSYLTGGIGVLDPAGGTGSSVLSTRPGSVFALPDRPDRTVVMDDWGQIAVYDLTTTPPSTVATLPDSSGRTGCWDAEFLNAGDLVVTACSNVSHHEVLHTADLTSAGSVASGESPNAVALSADARHVAAGTVNGDDITVTDTEGGLPGRVVRTYQFDGTLATHSLAFSADGRLYAVEFSNNTTAVLHVLHQATLTPTTVSLEVPKTVKYGGAVTGTGRLSGAPEGATVTVIRRDRNGEHNLGSVPVAADGSYTFTDQPGITGPVTYAVGYAGDDSHAASGVKKATTVRPLPYDVNADGYGETVVGAYAENIGTVKDAGMFHLMYGGATGVKTSGSLGIDQNSTGVPGTAEAGDMFGYSNTSGDFNGDGYADVAVSAGAENVGTATDGGAVWIFYGSASGLRTDNVASLDIADTVWTGTDHTYLGDALTAGDFDGDGRDDLAIGAAGVDEVIVARGTPDGLATTDLRYFSESTDGVPGTRHEDERFGHSVATGDVNADGRDDLAVGAAYDYDDRGWSTGSVTVLYGGTDGLTGTGAQRFSKDTTGVPGGGGSFDQAAGDASDGFGHQIALADFNGDGGADLAVGAPGSAVTVDGVRKRDAGTLTVLYSSGTAITTTGAVQVNQQTTGMPGSAGAEDQLGTTLAAGDTDGDGSAELAAYSVGDNYVTVVAGASGGLGFGTAKGWTQNTTGVPGDSETGDNWGNSLRFTDVKGTGYAALIVGADGENNGAGACTVIYGTSSGLTGTGSVYISQNTTGVPGTPEAGDGFGTFF